MQNREMIMHKVGKWFMIIGIAGVLSLLFIEWSRWNLVPLAEKINLVAVSENYHEFHTEFIEVGIATFSIFALFTAPYDIVKMTFIWTIIAFIIGKIW